MTDHAQIDQLAFDARFAPAELRQRARLELRQQAARAGIRLTSIRPLYMARARGEAEGFTVPAMNVRGMAYEFCRAILRAAKAAEAGAFVIEIARSEMEYTDQRPDELAVMLLAAALREGYRGPLFLQGDHYKVNPGSDGSKTTSEIRSIQRLIEESLAAGFYNIDIDASTTVDLSQPTSTEQQRQNGEITAQLAQYIRQRQSTEVAIGGEIGEIGGQVSTASDLRAFMQVFKQSFTSEAGIGKVAIQTGTSHGGTPNPDGSMATVNVDFEALTLLSGMARQEFGLAGAVQHGASTLPEDELGRFVEAGCLEIHLSTEFQNIIMQHPSFPAALMAAMHAYLNQEWSSERKPGMTDAQFFYKTRKRAWGPFKRPLADLPEATRDEFGQALEVKVASLFSHLHVAGTRSLVDRYVS